MTKVNKIFNILSTVVFWIFCFEMMFLLSFIDLLPVIVIGLVCGLIIMVKYRNGDIFSQINDVKEAQSIISFLILSFVSCIIFILFICLGTENLAVYFVQYLNESKLFRFCVYGVLLASVSGYLMTWCWTNNKPFEVNTDFGTLTKIFLFNYIVGILICIYWENYLLMSTYVMNIF